MFTRGKSSTPPFHSFGAVTSCESVLLVSYVSIHARFEIFINFLTYVSITFPLVDVQSFKSIVKPRYVLQPREPVWYRPKTNRKRKVFTVVIVVNENNIS